MSYQVLARKWRPKNFPEMVGQVHVLRALINALDNNRLHHAYLFTGTRGVGKTTVARILAKSLNCLEGLSSNPCGICAACQEIDEGRFVDLIEVDAASKTKVEDTRELLENVQYAPTSGRYKVYLIDEVHMLSTHSFNALLKTLEEPPEHVKFLLATTDPQKLPATVLSRCLQFNLKCLPIDQIVAHQMNILEKEGVEFEKNALIQIARAAEGSMRDSLSLLDQAIAFGGGKLQEAEVQAMLGTIAQHHVYELIDCIFANQAEKLLNKIADIASFAPNYSEILADIINVLHRVSLAQIVPQAIDDALGDKERIELLAQGVAVADLQLYYQIALMGRKDLPHAPDQRTGFEMVMLRMLAFGPVAGEPVKVQASSAPVNQANSSAVSASNPQGTVQNTGFQTSQQQVNNSASQVIPQQNSGAQQQGNGFQQQSTAKPGLSGIQAARAAMQGGASQSAMDMQKKKLQFESKPRVEPKSETVNKSQLEAKGQNQVASMVDIKPKYQASPQQSIPQPSSKSPNQSHPVDQNIASEYMQYADMQTDEQVSSSDIGVSPSDSNVVVNSHTTSNALQVNQPASTAAIGHRPAESCRQDGVGVNHKAKSDIKSGSVEGSIAVAKTIPAENRQTNEAQQVVNSTDLTANATGLKWNDILAQLSVSGITSQLAANCSIIRQTKDELVLKLEDSFANLLNATTKEKLEVAINQYFGVPVRLQIDLGKNEQDTPAVLAQKEKINQQRIAEQVIENDPIVTSMKSIFGAEVQLDSIQPV